MGEQGPGGINKWNWTTTIEEQNLLHLRIGCDFKNLSNPAVIDAKALLACVRLRFRHLDDLVSSLACPSLFIVVLARVVFVSVCHSFTMVLAELGGKISGALAKMAQSTVVDDAVLDQLVSWEDKIHSKHTNQKQQTNRKWKIMEPTTELNRFHFHLNQNLPFLTSLIRFEFCDRPLVFSLSVSLSLSLCVSLCLSLLFVAE